MTIARSIIRFSELRGRLKAVEIRRPGVRPLISGAQAALLALGIVVSSYQVKPADGGLSERFELSRLDGSDLDETLSASARSALLPLALVAEDVRAGST
jgi:hypothetical protein